MNAAKIALTPEEHAELSRRVRSATISQRDGRRARVILLESTTFLALRNAQPTRYVWNAKGEDILNKIQRAREAMAVQTNGRLFREQNTSSQPRSTAKWCEAEPNPRPL